MRKDNNKNTTTKYHIIKSKPLKGVGCVIFRKLNNNHVAYLWKNGFAFYLFRFMILQLKYICVLCFEY